MKSDSYVKRFRIWHMASLTAQPSHRELILTSYTPPAQVLLSIIWRWKTDSDIKGPGNIRKYYDNVSAQSFTCTVMMTEHVFIPGDNYSFCITLTYLNSRFQLCKVTLLHRCLIYSAVGWNSWPTMTHTLPNKRRQPTVAVGTPRSIDNSLHSTWKGFVHSYSTVITSLPAKPLKVLRNR